MAPNPQPLAPALTIQLANILPTLHPPNLTPARERTPLSRLFEPQHRRDTENSCGLTCLLAIVGIGGFIVLLLVFIFGKKPYGSALGSREPPD